MLAYVPDKILGLIPAYGEFPIIGTKYAIGVGEFYNVALLLFLIYIFFAVRKQKLYYRDGLIRKHATYLVSGKTGKGKTRFMAQLARDSKTDTTICVGNFFSGYTDVFYSSFGDFCAIQRDIAILGIMTNYEDENEKKRIQKAFPGYFEVEPETAKKIRKIKGKYDFLTLGDEFYAYLHNRNFMANFAKKDGKNLLSDLHQTRHANQTLILASQDADNLDYDLRQLAHNEIEVKSWVLDLFYGFDIYRYLSKHEQKTLGDEFAKSNRIPYLFFNFYLVAKVSERMYKAFYMAMTEEMKFKVGKWAFGSFNIGLSKRIARNMPKTVALLKSHILDYNSKSNVRPELEIYEPGQLFDFLINREKNTGR